MYDLHVTQTLTEGIQLIHLMLTFNTQSQNEMFQA